MMAPFQIYLSFQQFFADCMQIWVLRPANSRAQLVIWGLLNVSLAEQHQNLCDLRADAACVLAAERRDSWAPPEHLTPVYLRPPQAQRERAARLGREAGA